MDEVELVSDVLVHVLPRTSELDGCMSMTYIEIVELELGESIVESGLNVFGTVAVVPELGGDEDVLALQAGDLFQGLLDPLGDLLLVLVDLGQVEVAVAGLEGLEDALADLTGGSLPGAVAKGRDLVPGGEGGGSSSRHVGRASLGFLL